MVEEPSNVPHLIHYPLSIISHPSTLTPHPPYLCFTKEMFVSTGGK